LVSTFSGANDEDPYDAQTDVRGKAPPES